MHIYIFVCMKDPHLLSPGIVSLGDLSKMRVESLLLSPMPMRIAHKFVGGNIFEITIFRGRLKVM